MDKRRFTNNPVPNVIGDRFGKLTILASAEPYKRKNLTQWLCRCDCGTEKVFLQTHLRSGNCKSCGCEREARRLASITKHGRATSPQYKAWLAMKQRCENPLRKGYAHYGGRGIKVCDRWHTFENFLADMGERPAGHSLERIDNNGDYEPSNCRWATRSDQMRNTRGNRLVTFRGKTQTLIQWCEEYNLSPVTMNTRLNTYGWEFEDALTRPIGKTGRKPKAIYISPDHDQLSEAVKRLDVQDATEVIQ